MRETKNQWEGIGIAKEDASQPSFSAPVKFTIVTGGEIYAGGKTRHKEFTKVCVWNRELQSIALAIRAGDQVRCVGEIATRSYIDKNDQKRYVTEVCVRDRKEHTVEHESQANSGQHLSDEAVAANRGRSIQKDNGKPNQYPPLDESGIPF